MKYRIVKTSWGWCGLAGEAGKVHVLVLPMPSRAQTEAAIRSGAGRAEEDPTAFTEVVSGMEEYFAGGRPHWGPDVAAPAGTEFQKKVWRAAMRIPYGQTRTYAWLAARIGSPRATRAVGGALGRNPIPLIVPCHRIIRNDGSLGGFSAEEGVALKRRLLQLEGTIPS